MKKTVTITLLIMSAFGYSQNCKGVEETIDKFTGDKKYETTSLAPISIIKSIRGIDTTYYVSIYLYKRESSYNAYGAYILFENGEKIIKKEQKVDCKYSATMDQYALSSFFRVDQDDLAKFTTSPVTNFKLFVHEDNIGKGNANRIMEYCKCIVNK